MTNKETYHEYEIREYLEKLSVYDQDVIISDGENEFTAVLSCGQFEEIVLINQ